jgi:hypothetical protein
MACEYGPIAAGAPAHRKYIISDQVPQETVRNTQLGVETILSSAMRDVEEYCLVDLFALTQCITPICLKDFVDIQWERVQVTGRRNMTEFGRSWSRPQLGRPPSLRQIHPPKAGKQSYSK